LFLAGELIGLDGILGELPHQLARIVRVF